MTVGGLVADHVQATANTTVVANHFSAIHSSFQNNFATHAHYKMEWRSCGLLLQAKDRPPYLFTQFMC